MRRNGERLLPNHEVARRLGIHGMRVRQLAQMGLLQPRLVTLLGKLYHPADVERLRRARQASSNPQLRWWRQYKEEKARKKARRRLTAAAK